MRLRVLDVDDHEVIRAGVRSLLVRQSSVDRCVPATGGDDAADHLWPGRTRPCS